MKQRTEEQILTQAPVEVQLGNEKYPLKPLRLKKQWEWRKLFLETLKELFASTETDPAMILKAGIGGLMTKYPEKIIELIFAFDPALPKEKILEEATEEQILLAFHEIYGLTVLPMVAQAAALKQSITALSPQ